MKEIFGCILISLSKRLKQNMNVIEYYKKTDEIENIKKCEIQNELIKKIIIKTRTKNGRDEFIKLLQNFINS